MEVAVDQWRPVVETEAEEVVEVGLHRRQHHLTAIGMGDSAENSGSITGGGQRKGFEGHGGSSENSVYLDKNGGAVEDLDIPKILYNAAEINDNRRTEVLVEKGMGGGVGVVMEEEGEEEVVELEFEKAIPKLETHTMHCPNCDSHITRVVLRRKIVNKVRYGPVTERPHEPVDLLGCLSCFSLFRPSGNGRFNPFSVFGKGSSTNDGRTEEVVLREQGNCLSMFRVFRRGRKVPTNTDESPQTPQQPGGSPTSGIRRPEYLTGNFPIFPIKPVKDFGHNGERETYRPEKGDPKIDIPPETDNNKKPRDAGLGTEQENRADVGGEPQDSVSFEILKSVVYGGLMEVIASLSIVASAAASDATTLNIIALALANLIGGVFVVGHNLWDLRNDCYKGDSNQEANNKYKELLGQVNHFLLHAFFSVLSFLVFGIIPPAAYGFAFQQTADRDFTVAVVAAASLSCVGLMGLFKAYINRCPGFFGYVQTAVYYVTTAASASGASYVAGNLVTRLLNEVGLFDTGSGVGMPLLPAADGNPSLAVY